MLKSGILGILLGATALSISTVFGNAAAAQSTDDLLKMIEDQAKQIGLLQSQLNALRESNLEAVERVKALESRSEKTAAEVEKAPKKAARDFEIKWEPAPSIKSADGRFEMNLRGRIYADAGWVNDGDNTLNLKATEFRAARLGIEGKAWKDIKYKFEIDFAGNNVVIKDAYLEWSTPAKVKVALGQFKTPNSLEEQTSSRFTTFMERASFTDAFGFARQIGVGVSFGGDLWSAKFGAFRGGAGTDDEDEGTTLAGRLTFGPKLGEVQTHFGASFRYQKAGEDQGLFRYRQRPHNHQSDRFIDTGSIAEEDIFWGLEAAGGWGPVTIQGEFGWLKADVDSLHQDPTFSGGYIDISWFVTGEGHAYDPKKGSFGRPKVKNPVFKGGMGAWQIAARFDTIDLSEPFLLGGEQDTYIIGLNWYLNRHTRMMFNYSHSDISRAFLVSANGADGRNNVDAFGIRAQVDW